MFKINYSYKYCFDIECHIGMVLLTLFDFYKLNIMFSCLSYNKHWNLDSSTRISIIKYKSYKY